MLVSNIERWPGVLVSAAVMTLLLFYLMQALIETTEFELDFTPGYVVELVKPMEMDELVRKQPQPKKMPTVDTPPDVPQIEIATAGPGWGDMKLSEPGRLDEGPTIVLSDGPYLPILKVAPKYPNSAIRRQLEGFAVVEYDVWLDGSVRNPRVVDSEPPGVFDRSSVEAALKFRYKPMIENGEPVVVSGVQNLFTFQLDER